MSRLEPTNEASAIAEQGGGTTKVEQLIQQYCPDGVEYKRLGDVLGVNRGRRLTKMQLSDDGQYYVYHGSKDTPLGKYSQFNVKGNTTIVVNTGGIGGVKFCDDDFWCSDGSFWIGHSDLFNDKFVFYYLSPLEPYFASQKRVGGVPTIDRSVVENVEIPVPPLPVQEEIVRILDTLTELQAELQARQQQYEHYKSMLFSFDENVKEYSLMSLCSVITDGSHFSPKGQDGGFPMVSVKDMRSNCFTFNECKRITSEDYAQLVKNGCRPQKDDVLVAKDGSMLKYSFVADGVEDYVILSSIAILRPKTDIIIPKYLAYYFSQNDFKEKVIREHKTQGGVPRIVLTNFKKVIIKVPSLAEQQRIVDILDRFDALTTDITAGLPAEIEARRKQYEYYRDRLLTFNKK